MDSGQWVVVEVAGEAREVEDMVRHRDRGRGQGTELESGYYHMVSGGGERFYRRKAIRGLGSDIKMATRTGRATDGTGEEVVEEEEEEEVAEWREICGDMVMSLDLEMKI